jgi:hypothetical protein
MLGAAACQDRTVALIDPPESIPLGLTSSTAFQPGVKTGEQLAATMSALTGVARTDNTVRTAFNDLRSQLPMSHDIASFQASHQIAITKLATEYCDRLFENDGLRAALLPGVTFTNPNTAFGNVTARTTTVDRMTEKFWGTGLKLLPDANAAREELIALFGDLMAGAPNTGTGARNVGKGLCTAVLAASPVTLL